jgi:hypothetical protein
LAAADLLRLVVLFGSLETLQWCTASMLKQGDALPSLINRQALSFCAARRGDVHILAWLQHAQLLEFGWQNAHGARWALTDTSAEQGQFQTVRLLHEQGCPLDVYVCEAAARHGERAFLQWSHERGAAFGETEIARAAGEAGSHQLDMLIYLQSMIRPELWSGAADEALAVAGQHGHLQSVIWLRERAGAAWPAMLWGYSYWSDFGCVQWAIEHGASWGSEPEPGTCCTLRDKLTPQLFEFAHRHSCPCDCEVTDCMIVLWDDGQYVPAEPDIVSTEANYLSPADR